MTFTQDDLDEYYEVRKNRENIQESNRIYEIVLEKLKDLNHLKMIDILYGDVEILLKENKKKIDQSKRRGLVRSVFSYIEGNLFMMKKEILIIESYKRKPVLDNKELLLLQEVDIRSRKGKVIESPRYLDVIENIKFTVNCYCKSNQIKNPFDYKNKLWNYLKNSVNVRNRITHPKSVDDLIINDQEFKELDKGIFYYNFNITYMEKLTKKRIKNDLKSEKIFF